MTGPLDPLEVRYAVTVEPETATMTVCWIGWLPLSALCGCALGLIVGIGIGVLSA